MHGGRYAKRLIAGPRGNAGIPPVRFGATRGTAKDFVGTLTRFPALISS